jgi:cytochrome c-type biogenesis protein CcmH/NrfF
MGDGYWNNWVFNLLPTILVGLIFWVVMRSIFRADRTERKVYAQIEAEERARFDRDSGQASHEA